MEKKSQTLWSPINTSADANAAFDYSIKGLYIFAVGSICIAIVAGTDPLLIANGIVYGLIAFWLQKTKSKVPAYILAIFTGLSALAGLMDGNIVRIIFFGLMCWLSIRAIQAISKMKKA